MRSVGALLVLMLTACGGRTTSTGGAQGFVDGAGATSAASGGAPSGAAGRASPGGVPSESGGAAVVGDAGMSTGAMIGVAGAPVEDPCAAGWSLSEPTAISLGDDARDIVVEAGDLDGDGQSELVTRPWAEIEVYKRQASFALAGSYADDDWSGLGGDIELGDWNNDGWLDVIVEHESSVTWLQGDKGGALHAGIRIGALPGKSDSPAFPRLRLADLDRDGALDATLMITNLGKLVTFYGDGAGGLKRSVLVPAEESGYFEDFALIDVNDDGLLDVVGIVEGASPRVHYNKEGLLGGMSEPFGAEQDGAHSIEAGDVDGDGHPDLVISGGDDPSMSEVVMRYANAYLPEPLDSYQMPDSIAIADVTGDGAADLLVAHAGWEKLGVYVQCHGRLQPERLFDVPYAATYQHSAIAVAELDDDTCPDVVLGDFNSGLVFLHGSGCGH